MTHPDAGSSTAFDQLFQLLYITVKKQLNK